MGESLRPDLIVKHRDGAKIREEVEGKRQESRDAIGRVAQALRHTSRTRCDCTKFSALLSAAKEQQICGKQCRKEVGEAIEAASVAKK